MKREAFTLAEVLITLTIIGVVAAITVPVLINRTNKQEYVSALQKAYSTLSQASQRIIAEEGSPKASDGGWADSVEHVYELYKKYLNNVKDCSSESGCWVQGYKKLTDGKTIKTDEWENTRKLILADGMQVMFDSRNLSEDCSKDDNGTNDMCARIFVDINGEKKPNILGRDVFEFDIKEKGLFPAGCDSEYCEGMNGWGCACKVLREGAMNY